MTTILCLAQPDGSILMTPYQEATKRQFAKDNVGRIRMKLEKMTPESRNQRKFYHGAILPLWLFLDGKDYRNPTLLDQYHEIAKREFNGEWITVRGKAELVGKSTKGELNNGFLEKIGDFLEEQYGIDRMNLLNPEEYKKWRDEIFPFGGPETFIEYLQLHHRL